MTHTSSSHMLRLMEHIISQLRLQQGTIDEMVRENNSLSMAFGEILASATESSSSNTTFLASLIEQQGVEIDNYRAISKGLLDYFSRELERLRQDQNHTIRTELDQSQIELLEGPRRLSRGTLDNVNYADLSFQSLSDATHGTEFLSMSHRDVTDPGTSEINGRIVAGSPYVNSGLNGGHSVGHIEILCPYCNNQISLTFGPGEL